MLDPDTLDLVNLAADAAEDKKAFDVRALDVSALTSFTDAFLIVSTSSDRHLEAVADAIQVKLKRDRKPLHVEASRGAEWVLIDYGEFIVHVFTEERRAYFNLESLWGDAAPVLLADRPTVAS